MGEPIFHPSSIPFLDTEIKKYYPIFLDEQKLRCSVVSLGNPHCVLQVSDIYDYPVDEVGSKLSKHFLFPQGVNVGFMQVVSKEKILLRVYERHVGETQACGSGACAAVAIGIRNQILSNDVCVQLFQGQLKIFWNGMSDSSLYMSGPASHVYDGYIKY